MTPPSPPVVAVVVDVGPIAIIYGIVNNEPIAGFSSLCFVGRMSCFVYTPGPVWDIRFCDAKPPQETIFSLKYMSVHTTLSLFYYYF
jgi:hypothetical protein